MANYPETTRVARILDIIWRISREPQRWTRKDLAEAFEVSTRTIGKDLEIIRHRLHFDLESDRKRGYYFKSLPKLPSVSYSLPEALALILAAQASRQLGGISQPDLAAAIARLESVIPDDLRAMIDQFGNAPAASPDDEHRQDMLTTISRAASTNRRLEITYASASRGGAETTREVDPYALIPYQKSWHMAGYCHLRQDIRIFKIDRIKEVRETARTFVPDEQFDLTAFLNEGWGLMRGLELPVEEVELRFESLAARWVADETWHSSQKVAWNDDGTLTFKVRIQVTPEFQRWVFRYGREVQVVAPDHLREWVREEAAAILA